MASSYQNLSLYAVLIRELHIICSTLTFTFMHVQTLLSKATYIAFKLQFYILSALAFPGNRTHDLSIASAMLYHWATGKHLPSSNRKKLCALLLFNKQSICFKMMPNHNEIQTIRFFALFNAAGAIALAPQFSDKWTYYIFLFLL